MTTKIFSITAILFVAATMFSCQQVNESAVDQGEAPQTRAFGDKTPKVCVYVETNDTNPLNCGDYTLPNGLVFVDVVELFAANIHKETVEGQVRPTLYLNDKMTNLMENDGYQTYIKPLQDKGIKVLLTILGDHQGIGLSSMNSTQTSQFAAILAKAVEKYGLDGIGFDDEYADDYGNINATSYNEIITKLRAILPAGKLITVVDWGNTGYIKTDGQACLDWAVHKYYGSYVSSPSIGMDNNRWSPIAMNLGYNQSPVQARSWATQAKIGGYGAMMCFNIRRSSDIDPTNVFSAMAYGAGFGAPVTCSNGDRGQDWVFVPRGYTMTYAEATKN